MIIFSVQSACSKIFTGNEKTYFPGRTFTEARRQRSISGKICKKFENILEIIQFLCT